MCSCRLHLVGCTPPVEEGLCSELVYSSGLHVSDDISTQRIVLNIETAGSTCFRYVDYPLVRQQHGEGSGLAVSERAF